MSDISLRQHQDFKLPGLLRSIFILGLAGVCCFAVLVQNHHSGSGATSARCATHAVWRASLPTSPLCRRNLAIALQRLNGQIIPAGSSLDLTQALGPWLGSEYIMAPASEGEFIAITGSGAQIVARLACKAVKAAHLQVQQLPSDPRSPAPPGCNYLFHNSTASSMQFTATWEQQNLSVTLSPISGQTLQTPKITQPAQRSTFILATGDVATDPRAAPAAVSKPAKLKNLLHNWQGPDCFTISNLETPVTQSIQPTNLKTPAALRAKQEFIFRGTPQASQQILHSLGINAVTLANNHIFDQSALGMKQTVSLLKKQSIGIAGPISPDKAQVLRFTLGNHPWSLLSFCTTETVPANVSAQLGRGWLLNVSQKQIKKSCDYVKAVIQNEHSAGRTVIVAFHWGQEAVNTPHRSQQTLAVVAAQAGAAVILGHHPHRLQPLVSINDCLVAYSLGNFVFAPGQPAQANSGILVIEAQGGKLVAAGLLPVRCNLGGLPETVSPQGRHAEAILQDLGLLSVR